MLAADGRFEARIVPLPYSPVAARAPRMPTVSTAKTSPPIAWFVGSKPWYHAGSWCVTLLVDRIVTTTDPATVTSSIQIVDRSDVSLVSSALTTCLMV